MMDYRSDKYLVHERAEFAEKQVKEALRCLKYGNRTFEAIAILEKSYQEDHLKEIKSTTLQGL